MPDATINMNAPPSEFTRHRALLDDARERITDCLRRDGRNIDLDEWVVVVIEPDLAREASKPTIKFQPYRAVVEKFRNPRQRADLQKQPAPGFVRVALFTRGDLALLTMRVRPDVIILGWG